MRVIRYDCVLLLAKTELILFWSIFLTAKLFEREPKPGHTVISEIQYCCYRFLFKGKYR